MEKLMFKRRVNKTGGIKINHLNYFHPELAVPSTIGTQALIRYTRENVSIAYAFVNQNWVRLNCRNTLPTICSIEELR
jgi:hypothetical protein